MESAVNPEPQPGSSKTSTCLTPPPFVFLIQGAMEVDPITIEQLCKRLPPGFRDDLLHQLARRIPHAPQQPGQRRRQTPGGPHWATIASCYTQDDAKLNAIPVECLAKLERDAFVQRAASYVTPLQEHGANLSDISRLFSLSPPLFGNAMCVSHASAMGKPSGLKFKSDSVFKQKSVPNVDDFLSKRTSVAMRLKVTLGTPRDRATRVESLPTSCRFSCAGRIRPRHPPQAGGTAEGRDCVRGAGRGRRGVNAYTPIL